ncbi:MAG: CtsR family transcriptional regulator [Syntrophomonas sp.]|uniref:CtsR family transcriptional regulator n=1 Tax=Syntrophomonas sp. TaxID=2053627 RepID=UPI002617FC12|nr:CtsR family transcriptional regulator [Syntrophomonas sp.]MDD2509554.1 CtsR family transcriptional regulator [Syntrophomonas sp.]MDD3878425.1 CtsR family transcriptional regulator [Syntrophomonas sp.]MDD4625476.1 CtsR family transcriptional regulator [Syntrophomonas sp.]
MKKSLADRIEEYIKVLIARSEAQQIEIQRVELAETFSCVPSQVTYVIGTRFTEKAGYITESRRGGKGFIRISCCELDKEAAWESRQELFIFIDRLLEVESISQKEGEMLKHVISKSSKEMAPDQKSQFFDAFKYALADFLKK